MKRMLLLCGIAILFLEAGNEPVHAIETKDLLILAEEYRSRKEFDKAIAILEKGLEGADEDTHREKIQASIADIYFTDISSMKKAADVYTKIAFLHSGGANTDFYLYRLALCYENLQDYVTAAKYYDMLILEYSDSSLLEKATEGSQRCFTHNIQEYAAVVNGEPITVLELEAHMENLPSYYKMRYQGEEGKTKLLNEMIEQKLLLLEAQRSGLDKEGDIVAHLEKEKSNYLTNEIVDRRVYDRAHATDGEVEEYWEKHKDDYRSSKTHHIYHIQVDGRALADSLYQELKKGEDFSAIASEHSEHFSSRKGGDMDFYNPRILPEEVNRIVAGLAEGELSGVIQSPRGYHIVKLVETKQGELPSYDTVKQKIRVKIEHNRRMKLYNELITQLKGTYPVEVYYNLK
jgi:peptidyl-prolyl cis-trans isomerase C